jgi:lysophospholipase L1-like esterase
MFRHVIYTLNIIHLKYFGIFSRPLLTNHCQHLYVLFVVFKTFAMPKLLQKKSTGVLLTIVCTLTVVILAGCTKKATVTNILPITDTAFTGNVKRLLALGDSYTIGQSVAENERFANQTITLLQAAGAKIKYPAQIIAQTGWTTQNLLNGISTANPAPVTPYDAVTLLIGVNNQYQKKDTAAYRTEFIQCLNNAITFTGSRRNRVFVLSIPDYGATPFGSNNAVQIALEIDRFNAINKQVCLQMGIDYTDITASTREAVNDPSLVAADGLHPSGKEYTKWASRLAAKILPLVK